MNIEEEIRTIYREYFKDVYHFIVSFTSSHDEAEDLTQEVFVRLFKSLPRFNGRSDLKTWIFSIAKNVAIDHYRSLKRQIIFNDLLLKLTPSKEKTTEEIVEAKEDLRNVDAALKNLKYDYRMVIVLRGINEFTIKETATILGWSESKVKVNYHRGLKLLKESLVSENILFEERWLENE
ncbi:RNA polymerase sigma factor [Anaerobacillus sp. CMMVII]|uniref:RNA polymerase sigma factor n=1 Tax=Anaerobacillus sp. CMMVII TaxID=2755588 RepID=UPI0028E0A161|nr:RNA polymerase sigma factor [Anaerobacillus sp. CMMVII]